MPAPTMARTDLNVFRLTNPRGRTFNARVLAPGDRYGLNGCLTCGEEPMVEFYDATYEDEEGFSDLGQFTGGRYYLSTLLGEGPYAERVPGQGLLLYGAQPEWSIGAHNLTEVLGFAQGYLRGLQAAQQREEI